jgi:hypothetical protein
MLAAQGLEVRALTAAEIVCRLLHFGLSFRNGVITELFSS